MQGRIKEVLLKFMVRSDQIRSLQHPGGIQFHLFLQMGSVDLENRPDRTEHSLHLEGAPCIEFRAGHTFATFMDSEQRLLASFYLDGRSRWIHLCFCKPQVHQHLAMQLALSTLSVSKLNILPHTCTARKKRKRRGGTYICNLIL